MNPRPEFEGFANARAIYAVQERLGLPDLMGEVADRIHLEVEEGPDVPHLITMVGTTDIETLLVGSVYAAGYFSDFALLSNETLTQKLFDDLLADAGEIANAIVGRTPGHWRSLFLRRLHRKAEPDGTEPVTGNEPAATTRKTDQLAFRPRQRLE
jgi:hypothetical protein